MRLRAADLRGRGLAALLLAVAAGIAGAQLPGGAQAMVGGAPPAPGEFGRSVVMILGSSGTACTATAIGRDVLLTAAHCVQPGADYKLLGSEPGQPPALKTIVRIERHPQFDVKRLLNHLATADVALIKLAEPLPARISPALIAGGSETVAVGDSLVVAGYGVTVRGDGRTGGTARAATLVVTGQPGPLQIRLFDPVSKGLSAGLGACSGDSGAPAFRTSGAGPAILGVVSWSTGPNLTAGCGGLTGIMPLARYRGWIVDTARSLGTPLRP
ncbi:MAG: S1 family peptidase [Betaproteobacteria bacterium]